MHRSEVLLTSQSQKKAKCHRRRYAPVGPAGVLFQAHREQLNVKNGALVSNSSINEEIHEEERGIEFSQGIVENAKAPTAGVVFYSRAWVDMLCQLQIVTPMLRAYLSEEQRYTTIRRFVPQKFTMVSEILRGQLDWKLPPGKSLLVLVHAIDSRSDTLWVAELLDETGSTISAWIKPRFVEQEQKLPKYVRVGMVWMLKDVTIILDSSPGRGVDDTSNCETDEYRRMLLVGEQNIESVWAPPSNEEASDTADPRFIEWMEKRNTLTSSLEVAAEDCDIDLVCEGEETFPIDRTNQVHVVQEEKSRSLELLPADRDRQLRCSELDDYSSAPLTTLVQTAEANTPIDLKTVHGGNQRSRQPKCNSPSSLSPITRKRKDVEDDRKLGLWTVVCPVEELTTFSCDDDDDDADDEQQQEEEEEGNASKRFEYATETSSHSAAPLFSSPCHQPATSEPVAAIFQNTDFVSCELDCSSDEE